ncbi:cytidine/deoxycytidylate deaminase family protein, partial [Streptomyces sp. L500]
MITPADHKLLRHAIGIATHAITLGDAPYGSLLAGPDGAILAEAHNTVR